MKWGAAASLAKYPDIPEMTIGDRKRQYLKKKVYLVPEKRGRKEDEKRKTVKVADVMRGGSMRIQPKEVPPWARRIWVPPWAKRPLGRIIAS